jgi:hypothetical protein
LSRKDNTTNALQYNGKTINVFLFCWVIFTFCGGLGSVNKLMITMATVVNKPRIAAKCRKSTLLSILGLLSDSPLPQTGAGSPKSSPIRIIPIMKLNINPQNAPYNSIVVFEMKTDHTTWTTFRTQHTIARDM